MAVVKKQIVTFQDLNNEHLRLMIQYEFIDFTESPIKTRSYWLFSKYI